MKTTSIYKMLFLCVCGSAMVSFTSCTKDTPVITPATPVVSNNENNLSHGVANINYSVQVVPVGTVSNQKTAGLQNATVALQINGQTKTVTVDASGIAVFSNVAPGQISGYVSSPGYTGINFTATLTSSQTTDVTHTDYAASTIYVVAKNSSLNGRVYGDFDLDGNTNISEATNFQSVNLWITYDLSGYPMGSGSGALATVAMDTINYSLASDIAGNFTFNNLPSTINGITAKLKMQDVKKINPVGGGSVIFNFAAPIAVTLNPGATTSIGDKQAM